jgi:hypothetical protein
VEALEGISDGMECGSLEVEKEFQIPINLSPIEYTKTLHQNITSITPESQGRNQDWMTNNHVDIYACEP